jgi:glycolate oxidase
MPAEFLAALRRIMPPDAVLDTAESLRPYECDGLSVYRKLPGVVCLPETV